MKLIVGLGNPGQEYQNTRHNIGFKAIDAVASSLNVKLKRKKFNTLFYKGKDFILAKPQTYMNLSGDSVVKMSNFFKIDVSDILVVYDEMDLKIGTAIIKPAGSTSGHNGISDVISKMRTSRIARLKIGIGRNHNIATSHVLGKFSPQQILILNGIKENIVKAINYFINIGVEEAMLFLNSK